MHKLCLVLLLVVASVYADKCSDCTSSSLKEHMSSEQTPAYWCENAYEATAADFCIHNGACADMKAAEKHATTFCAPLRKKVGCAPNGGRDSANCKKTVSLGQAAGL